MAATQSHKAGFISLGLDVYPGDEKKHRHVLMNVRRWKNQPIAKDEAFVIPPVEPQPGEIESSSNGLEKALSVGIWPRTTAAPHRKKGAKGARGVKKESTEPLAAAKSSHLKGLSVDSISEFTMLEKDPNALRAVVQANPDATLLRY